MGAVAILFVLLAGLAINNENAETKVESFDDFKVAVEKTIDEVKERDGFVSHKLND